MQLHRRKILGLAVGTAAVPAALRFGWAQAYPSRPVRIMVGFAAGGTVDTFARMIGQWLSDRTGQSFVVENRLGAGGNIATEAVARAAPDGYTLLQLVTSHAINATLYDRLNFNITRDITPVASIAQVPLVMVVHPSVPASTIPEFIAYARANPGRINMASAGVGTPQHVAGELFKMMAGIDMTHVPYRGNAPALTDLVGGQVQVMIDSTTVSLQHIRSGRLRALAVTTTARVDTLPDVPCMSDFLPGYQASAWFGIATTRNAPADVVERLNAEINAGLADARIKARIAEQGGMSLPGTPADFAAFFDAEIEKWGRVARQANIRAE